MPLEQFANLAFTNLKFAINNTDTTLEVMDSSKFPQVAEFRIVVDGELMKITGGANTPIWTVQRGIEGTTAIAHSAGAVIVHVLTKASLEKFLSDRISFGNYADAPTDAMNGSVYFPVNSPYCDKMIYNGTSWDRYFRNVKVDRSNVYSWYYDSGNTVVYSQDNLSFQNQTAHALLPTNWTSFTLGVHMVYNQNSGNVFLGLGKGTNPSSTYTFYQVDIANGRWFAFIEQDNNYSNTGVYLGWQGLHNPQYAWYRCTKGAGNIRTYSLSNNGYNYLDVQSTNIAATNERITIRNVNNANNTTVLFDLKVTTS